MFEQPSEDFGTVQVLLVVALVLVVLVIGVIVLVYEYAPQHHSWSSTAYRLLLASAGSLRGSVLVAVRCSSHRLQHPAADSQ
jgi:NhaP-type Na+/H+ or K+/H+ antiporter